MERWEVQTEVKEDDLTAYFRAIHKPAGLAELVRTLLAIGIAVACFAAMFFGPSLLQGTGVPPLVLSVFVLGATAFPLFVVIRHFTLRDRPEQLAKLVLERDGRDRVLGRLTVIIDPDGLEYQTEWITAKVRWDLVSDIVVNDDFVFTSAAYEVLVLPRRSFESDEHFRKFAKAARRYRNEAPNYERHCPKCGYDLRGAVRRGCPECGWRREEPSAQRRPIEDPDQTPP